MATRGPEREVTARGMTEYDDVAKIEVIDPGDNPEKIDRPRDVLEGPWVSAPRVTEAAVFDVPNRVATPPKVVGDPVHQFQAWKRGLPASAMDDHNHPGAAGSGR